MLISRVMRALSKVITRATLLLRILLLSTHEPLSMVPHTLRHGQDLKETMRERDEWQATFLKGMLSAGLVNDLKRPPTMYEPPQRLCVRPTFALQAQ